MNLFKMLSEKGYEYLGENRYGFPVYRKDDVMIFLANGPDFIYSDLNNPYRQLRYEVLEEWL